jgi:ethanolamine ammonia-lyase small subunit
MFARRTQKTNQIQPVPDVTVAEMSLAAREALRSYTPARLGLERTGVSLATRPLLDLASLALESKARDRATYLRRPDLGRALSEDSAALLKPGEYDVVFVIADGLSALAVERQALRLMREVLPLIAGWRLAPVCVVEQGRVAIGDAIGEALRAPLAVVLIGERPGLSSPDSLGVYITWEPRLGRRDSERNCISNVREEGLGYAAAANRLHYYMQESSRLHMTGLGLKDPAGDLARLL